MRTTTLFVARRRWVIVHGAAKNLNPDALARLVVGLIVVALAAIVGAAGIYIVVIAPIVSGGAQFDVGELTTGEWLFVLSWFVLLGTNLYLLLTRPRR